jgi:hypothetical protein
MSSVDAIAKLYFSGEQPPRKGVATPCANREPPVPNDLLRRKALVMSVPVPAEPSHGGRWETIRYALDSNARTIRLCVIWFVSIVSPVVAAVITMLMRHTFLFDVRVQAVLAAGSNRRRLDHVDGRSQADRIVAARVGPKAPACSGLAGVCPACTFAGRDEAVVSAGTPR